MHSLQVGDGITNFTPTPSESRALVRESYSVPKTLLVRFANDSIDETPEMAAVVTGKFPRDATQLVLPGKSTGLINVGLISGILLYITW